jgi:hypothetical protein
MSDLTVTDRLLIQAAAAGDLTSRLSRGYDEDNKPEGWPVLHYGGEVVSCDDYGRLDSLERFGYLTWGDVGPVLVTGAGREAIR